MPRGGYVGPQTWASLTETGPATVEEWRRRLGGGGPATLAVLGAMRRGRAGAGDGRARLVEGSDGRLHLMSAQMPLELQP